MIGTGDGGQGGRSGDIGSHNTLSVTHIYENRHATPLKGDSLSSLAILV